MHEFGYILGAVWICCVTMYYFCIVLSLSLSLSLYSKPFLLEAVLTFHLVASYTTIVR